MQDALNNEMTGSRAMVLSGDQERCDAQEVSETIQIPRDVFTQLIGCLRSVPQNLRKLLDRVDDLESLPTVQAPTSFPRFAELPTELRLRIWKFAYRSPRIVGVECTHETKFCSESCSLYGLHSEEKHHTYMLPVTPKASMLEVSIEARSVVLKETISLLRSNSPAHKSSFPNIRFNLDQDILWILDVNHFVCFWNAPQMGEIATKRIAFFHHTWGEWNEENLAFIQSSFPFLEELILVVGAEVDFRHQEIKFVKPARKPWHYNLAGFADWVDSSTTWSQIEVGVAIKVANLIEDRWDHMFSVFEDLGIDLSRDDSDHIDGTTPLWPWETVTISYLEIVAASSSIPSALADKLFS